jgi:hypothetical protein
VLLLRMAVSYAERDSAATFQPAVRLIDTHKFVRAGRFVQHGPGMQRLISSTVNVSYEYFHVLSHVLDLNFDRSSSSSGWVDRTGHRSLRNPICG